MHLLKRELAIPKFFKARPIPYAFREKAEKEILCLLEEGILEPVKTTESATSIAPVLKSNGCIRICGDFKLATNKSRHLEQYPLLRIENLFTQLTGECLFSKLDHRDAILPVTT